MDGQLDIFEILEILKKRWRLAAGGAIACAGLCFLYLFFFVPKYYKSSAILISSAKDQGISMGGVTQMLLGGRGGAANQELQQYDKILKTVELNQRVQKRLLIDSRIKIETTGDGPTLILEVAHQDPQFAFDAVRAFLAELEAFLQEINIQRAQTNQTFFQARLQEAEKALNQLENRMTSMGVNNSRREYLMQEKVLTLLREQFEMAQIEAKKQQINFNVIDPPRLPSKPAGPKILQPTLMTFAGTLILFSFILLLIELISRERQIRSAQRFRVRTRESDEKSQPVSPRMN